MKKGTPVWWRPEKRPHWWLAVVPGREMMAAEVVRAKPDHTLISFLWPPGERSEKTSLVPTEELEERLFRDE